MKIDEACAKLGIPTERLFQEAYQRYGLIYSIGPPGPAHTYWKKHGVVPIYVTRFCKDAERMPHAPQPYLL